MRLSVIIALAKINTALSWSSGKATSSFCRGLQGRTLLSEHSCRRRNSILFSSSENLDFDSLMDMDVVVFSRKDSEALELGAVQEDGTMAPLSAWTMESAFSGSDSIEFLVDEEDRFPGLSKDDVIIYSVLDESLIGYGSRQVGGGKGPGNPHGEESELLYYVDRSVLLEGFGEKTINVVLKPELEILW